MPRICAYYGKNADAMSSCWGQASSRVTGQAIKFLQDQSAFLAGQDPFVDSRKLVLRGIHWPKDSSQADCWASSDECNNANNPPNQPKPAIPPCNADYAKTCCAGCPGWKSESSRN